MIDHYNAFISYKHAPEDNVVAEAVHRGLERFHIPGKLRKKTGFKRIARIFRDKDELPITSDLSDTISHALENSDRLIVICSTNTKKSAWVPREIEYFLKNHSKRDIFTVLVNGEPYEVIPEILLYEEKVVTDENGNEKIEKIPIEPLSCDFRESIKKAKKTELPRLAAGLIGCSYDELMNRRRQYRMKQLMAGVSVALAVMLAFSGYMYYSKVKIHKTYLESLKNQSRYLANESGNLLEKEQRITALELALAALPKDDSDDRPVIAEAVKALNDATLAYVGDDGTNINAAWNYEMPNVISDFKLGENTIAIRDQGSVVGVWNTDTHERIIYLDSPKETLTGIAYIDENKLIIWGDRQMECYDVSTGNKLWEYASEKIFRDEKNLMIKDDSFYIGTIDDKFTELEKNTGKTLSVLEISGVGEEGTTDGFVECVLSPDQKKIAVRVLKDWNSYTYGIIDIATGVLNVAEGNNETIKNIYWIDNDRILMDGEVVDSTSSMSVGEMDLLSPDHTVIRCISATDLSEIWNTEFVCTGVNIKDGFLKLDDNNVAYYSGNVVAVLDIATGKEQYRSDVNSSVVDISDRDGDGTPIYITENGGYAVPASSIEANAVYYVKRFTDDIRQAVVHGGVYVRQQLSSEVIYYGINVFDDSWKCYDDNTVITDSTYNFCFDKDSLFFLSTENDHVVITGLDLAKEKTFSRTELADNNKYAYKLLGASNGRVYLAHTGDDLSEFISMDVYGNDQKVTELSKTFTLIDSSVDMKGNRLVFHHHEDKTLLTIYDLTTGDKKDMELPDDIMIINHAPWLFDEANVVYLSGDGDKIFDIDTGKTVEVEAPDDFEGAQYFSDNSSGDIIACSDGKNILLLEKNGKVKNTIPCPGTSPLGMTFSENELYVLYNDGGLYRYNVNSGECVRKDEISVYYASNDKTSFEFDKENGLLFVQMGNLMDILDLESGVELAHITNCLEYRKDEDIFITASGDSSGKKIGYYKRYSVDELMEKARDILKGTELSDDLKSRYGIE